MLVNPVTVLLAEDHMIVREGLIALLKLEKDIAVVGEAENGRVAVEQTRLLRPEVVVMDIAMPLLNGLEATRQILQASPETKVLVLSAHSDDAYVEMVMALGASGYLVKQSAAHVLPEAIREAHKGNTYFSPTIARRRNQLRQKSQARGTVRNSKNEAPPAQPARTRSAPTHRRRQDQQGIRRRTPHQLQNGRETPSEPHGKTQHPRHRRPHPLRHCRPHHREQRAGDDNLAGRERCPQRSATFRRQRIGDNPPYRLISFYGTTI